MYESVHFFQDSKSKYFKHFLLLNVHNIVLKKDYKNRYTKFVNKTEFHSFFFPELGSRKYENLLQS